VKPGTGHKGLFWFSEDLRTTDHALLAAASRECRQLTCVYVLQPWQFNPQWTLQAGMGRQRLRFLLESLHDLASQLKALGLRLDVYQGHAVPVIEQLCDAVQAEVIYRSESSGCYERKQWRLLQQRLPRLIMRTAHSRSLYDLTQLPFALPALPASFTPFRKQIETAEPTVVEADPVVRSEAPEPVALSCLLSDWDWMMQMPEMNVEFHGFQGGSQAGQAHLEAYFSSTAPSRYKKTRNALSGWSNSTRFSPWLAMGCVSPGQVLRRLTVFEQEEQANESTYWIYFELLWREYFYWYAQLHQQRLFLPGGVKGQIKSDMEHMGAEQRFAQWCSGRTGQPLVDACMRELNHTGYMSNRGRQLVASFLIHELALDWRWGAAYFEQQLMDYDVGSNWGNWQYIAGVGADPRGGRQFNISKQQQMFDPNGTFVEAWPAPGDLPAVSWGDLFA